MVNAQAQLSSLFDWLLGATFQAVVLVLLILILQAALRRRLEARWHYALWLILAVRLALPWAPSSRLSLFNWIPGFTETAAVEQPKTPAITETPAVTAPPLPSPPLPADPPAPMSEPTAVGTDELAMSSPAAASWLPSPRRLAEWLWLTAAAALAGWTILANARFWARVRTAPAVTDAAILRALHECSRQMGLKSPPRLMETNSVSMPSLYGLVRPRLLMPTGLVQTLSAGELRHVFLHEMAHLKRFDTAVSLLAAAVQILHWFNPLVWLAFRRMRDDREIACDALVLSRLQRDESRAYAETLIRLAERFGRSPWRPGVAGILEGANGLTRRITMISRFNGARRGSQLSAVILLGILGCTVLTDARDDSRPEAATPSFSPEKSYVITPGQGIDIIHVGNSAAQVEAAFGKPPKTQDTGSLRWINYRDQLHVDFLLDKASDKILEIRFNTGFKGELPDGTRLGDLLDDVLARHDGPTKTVDAGREQTDTCAFGDNRVLYRRHSRGLFGGLAKSVDTYKFIDGPRGILYWFDKDKKMTQLVVFKSGLAGDGEKAVLPETSHIDANGRIVDKIDHPFVNDPEAIGKWESVDFVKIIEDFKPGKPQTPSGRLFLKGLVFYEGGRASFAWKGWTKGLVMHEGDKTASKYIIKDIGGTKYMFFEWKSGDYTIRHQKPMLYVLKKLPADSPKFNNPTELYAADRMGPKAELSLDSRIDKNGRIIDKIDYPFVSDPDVIGKWESVDFVKTIGDFNPAKPKWKGDLFLKEMVILPNGRTSRPWWTWTKGMIFHSGDRTASRYTIKEMNGATYMFFEWKSGDYVIMHRKPPYYVLKKTSSDTSSFEGGWAGLPSDQEFARDLQTKVAGLDIGQVTLEDVVKVFGKPAQYLWGTAEFKRDQLPDRYIMIYPAGFHVFMHKDKIVELRFSKPGYRFEDKLQVGSSLDEALKLLGAPSQTVTGQKCEFKDRVLYQDMDGRAGSGYYACQDRNVRMFFLNDKIIALYVTRPEAK